VCKFVTCITLISNCKIGVICVTTNAHVFYIVMDETSKFTSHKCPELWPTTIRKKPISFVVFLAGQLSCIEYA
jgi:hypothetical protein